MIDIRHLRSLAAIAESGKITTAAKRVHITQSALSHQIKALETHYGQPLFERGRGGLTFTAAGDRFLGLAREVLGLISAAERDVARLKTDMRGQLRIALECHTCFDWLMPVMDEFRRRWPEVEVDLVAGFHEHPLLLIGEQKADMVIGSKPSPSDDARELGKLSTSPLFEFEILALIANEHPLRLKKSVTANDFIGETLITYPVPEARIDFIREVLTPAGVTLERRTAELTVAILQLVASRRGIAALPSWGVKNYIEHDYVLGKRIGKKGLWSQLYAITLKPLADVTYVQDFVSIIRDVCTAQLDGIVLL